MNRKINVAFVGVGEFITGNHLPNIKETPEKFNVRWLCDLNKETLLDRIGKYAPQYSTNNINDVTADPEVDLIIIGTRQYLRLELIRKCAEAGKNIFVEKPMSLSTSESIEIIKTVRKSGVRLQVGYNRRFAPAVVKAKKLLDKIRKESSHPAMINYRAVDESYLWPDWAFSESHGGKVFHEGCHFYDLACFLMNSFPVSIYVAGEIKDNQISTLKFSDGSIFSIINSGEGCASYPKERMEVFCGWNTIIMENFIELLHIKQDGCSKDVFPLFREKGKRTDKIITPSTFNRLALKWRKNISDEEFRRRYYYGSLPMVNKGHLAQFEFIAEALENNKPFTCNEIDGANATYLCEKGIESIRTGKAIGLNRDFLKKIS
ncbi:MAG: hypothetical protein A2017_08090 [Lentisphaerae bacterium GWF2_44_16]|nr:MAG: hypothetical protein A2017_08090 [Lentisphaerae bacterium GWF2_44_16]